MKKIYSNLKPNDFPFGDEINQQLANVDDNFKDIEAQLTGSVTQIDDLSLLVDSWSLVSGLYEYDLAESHITADMIVDVIPNNGDIQIVIDAQILARTLSSAGSVKLYAINAPADNIGVTIILTKKM